MTSHRPLALAAAFVALGGIAGAWFWHSYSVRNAPASPAPEVTLAVSGNYIGSGLVLAAAEKGYFAEEGLKVALQRHTSGRDALDAALEGKADLATAGDTPLMFAVMRDVPLSIVATLFTAGGAHGIVARRDRGIATPADLSGKRIGTTLGTDGHFVTDVLMSAKGGSIRSTTLLGTKPEALAGALASGEVDAVSTWEPWVGHARKALGDNAVAFMTDAGFRFSFSLAGRKDWVQGNQDTSTRLLRALLRAEDFASREPAAFQALVVEATGADPSVFNAGGASYQFLLRLDQSLLIMIEDEGRWAMQADLVGRRELPNLLEAIDTRPMDAVKPGAVTIVR